MKTQDYIGHPSQLVRVEQYRLEGGRGDGLRLLEVDNGQGLRLTLNLDRALDISRLSYKGNNIGYFSPCGYTHPSYYQHGDFIWAFTAGFLTTCGLDNVGIPNEDEGLFYQQHGMLSYKPVENFHYKINEDQIIIYGEISDEAIFGRKLRLHRKITIGTNNGKIRIDDEIKNTNHTQEAAQIMYHFNIGYPMLDEDSVFTVSSESVNPRDTEAATDIDNWTRMEKPTINYKEKVFYHQCKKEGVSTLYQPKLNTKLTVSFDPENLDCFTQWKMMGIRDYVLGIEPGNCNADGRHGSRERGLLKTVESGESLKYFVEVELGEE